MAGSRQTNTFGEMLQKLLRDLADMKVAPDADLPFIVDLETQVISKLRQGIDNVAGSGASQVPGSPPMGMAAGMGIPLPPTEGVPGVRSNPVIPPGAMDELRRTMAA